MSQGKSRPRPAPRATPPTSRRPLGPMPRQARPTPRAAAPASTRPAIFGVPWPLPVSPLVAGLVLLFVVVTGGAWFFEGRFESPPADAARRLLPYKVDDLQAVVLTTSAGSATYTRDSSGTFTTGGPAPPPTPVPPPGATPGPVQLPPSTKLEGMVGQLAELRIDRVLVPEASQSAEFGLDNPQLTLVLTPKQGAPGTVAVGQLNPDKTAYYVRRESSKDTVLVSRYTVDDLLKVANDLITAG